MKKIQKNIKMFWKKIHEKKQKKENDLEKNCEKMF